MQNESRWEMSCYEESHEHYVLYLWAPAEAQGMKWVLYLPPLQEDPRRLVK